MRRILLAMLWIAVILFLVQILYFVFFTIRAPRYNEGRPLHTTALSVPIRRASSLFRDAEGFVWIGTDQAGLYRLNPATGESQTITVPTELNGASVCSLAKDRQDRLWVGTSCHGLFVKSGDEWKHDGFGARIFVITVAPDGDVFVATEQGLTVYHPESDSWTDVDIHPVGHHAEDLWQISGMAFDAQGDLFIGTACHGIIQLHREETGNYQFVRQIQSQRRFGPGSSPNVSPVPLDSCGEGLPSNQINALLIGSDGTIWGGTAAGLAWSRDRGEHWYYVRGRDYGDKMRGLLAGTPYQWRELPRVRFGELIPEDDIVLLQEDRNGILWMGTRTLGCVALKPDTFYRSILPKSDDMETAMLFFEEMAKNTTRFHGTKFDQIVAMAPTENGKILLASRFGLLETAEYPASEPKSVVPISPPSHTESTTIRFPREKTAINTDKKEAETAYPYAAFLADDFTAHTAWKEKYGKTYTLIGGGALPLDQLIAFDESLCKVRPFAGFIGNRTRPLERITLAAAKEHHHRHHGDSHDEHGEFEKKGSLTAWSCDGYSVPRTYDGQHLWCEVKLNQPGCYVLSLFFMELINPTDRPRDHLIEVFPAPPASKTRIPKGDWEELGRRADEWGANQTPLAVSRITNFHEGTFKRIELAGQGTYYIKIDKNYSRKIDLCAVLIDRLDSDVPDHSEMPEKSQKQTADVIP
jgi:sugar lactone lactonase YvrE